MHAARSLIGTGIGSVKDIDRIVALVEERGLEFKSEQVALVVGLMDEKVRVTNSAQICIEQHLAERATLAAQNRSGTLSPAALRQVIDASGLDFDREPEQGAAQKAAIYALGTGGGLTILTGVAGAGKMTLLKPLVDGYRAEIRHVPAGREVIGIATAWRQADALQAGVLQDAGIERTFAVKTFFRALDDGRFKLSPIRS